MEFPSLPFIARNLAADNTKTALDHHGFWDFLTRILAEKEHFPTTTLGKLTAIQLMSVASSIVDLNLGGNSIIGKIITDTPSAIGSRLFGDLAAPAASKSQREIAALFMMEAADQATLLKWFRTADKVTQDRFRDQWKLLITDELKKFVELSEEDKCTLLELRGKSLSGPSSIGTFLDRLARLLNPFPSKTQ